MGMHGGMEGMHGSMVGMHGGMEGMRGGWYGGYARYIRWYGGYVQRNIVLSEEFGHSEWTVDFVQLKDAHF